MSLITPATQSFLERPAKDGLWMPLVLASSTGLYALHRTRSQILFPHHATVQFFSIVESTGLGNELGIYSMACSRPKHILYSLQHLRTSLWKFVSKRQSNRCKKYITQLYGFDFGEVAKKQGQDMLPSMETHWTGYRAHKIALAVRTFDAPSKKKKSQLCFYINLVHFFFEIAPK